MTATTETTTTKPDLSAVRAHLARAQELSADGAPIRQSYDEMIAAAKELDRLGFPSDASKMRTTAGHLIPMFAFGPKPKRRWFGLRRPAVSS